MKYPKMILTGVSVCPAGEENYERYKDFRGKSLCQYDYRHTDGELFSIVKPTLKECRIERDKWLTTKLIRDSKRQEIRQNGLTIVHSNDGISVPLMFRNLTGQNFTDPQEYSAYVQNMIAQIAFQYGIIELVADGVTYRTGTIREQL